MRWNVLLREVWLNVQSGTSRSAQLCVVFSILLAGLIYLDLGNTHSIELEAQRYRESGASIITLEAIGRIDGTACDHLSKVPGIHSSGALRREPTDLIVAALPAAPVSHYAVTPGLRHVLHITDSGTGLLLSSVLAQQVAAGPGDELLLSDRQTPIADTFNYPDDGRRAGFGYAALSQEFQSEIPFDECWAEIWPTNPELESLLSLTVYPATDDETSTSRSQLNTTLGKTFDGRTRFAERITALSFALAGALGAFLGVFSVASRRIQHARSLHFGLHKRDLHIITILETLTWVAPSMLIAGSGSILYAEFASISDSSYVLVISLRIMAWAAFGSFLGASLAMLAVRERHLFKYFKDR
ncbi:hypothetical protein [Leucobacter denitrificans]|uniref:ABC transporter permease n=1 Tax=Leucobacter denitrificans TaxID=683042 RepID=A0A7G9S2S1_9MICO|nr:hypothetical protein [Leucobacter denitrificans]QNN62146.1 hypothetical protein H9L06_07545 [Leucobacter denitrificans]